MEEMSDILTHFTLKEKPFQLLPNPRFMYLSEPYLETKAKIQYFLKDRSASLYLFGGIGTGKTSLLRLIAQEVSDDKETLARYIIAPALKTSNQLLRLICDNFGVKTERSQQATLKNLENFLIKQAKAKQFPLVLIDEAQNLTHEQLKLIHYLLNFVSNEQVLLMIVLVGQPELSQKIERFSSLKSRLISASLSEMTRDDMERMIKFRWSVAAGDPKLTPPFNKLVYDLVYQITKGNPRETVKLCYGALLQAFLKKAKTITKEDIKKAQKEL